MIGPAYRAVRMRPESLQFLETLVTQVGAAQHQQRRHRERRKHAQQQCDGHQDQLVAKRTARNRPHHRQFALGTYPGDLLRIQCQVVTEHAGGFPGCDLGHQCHIIEHGGDVVEQCQQQKC